MWISNFLHFWLLTRKFRRKKAIDPYRYFSSHASYLIWRRWISSWRHRVCCRSFRDCLSILALCYIWRLITLGWTRRVRRTVKERSSGVISNGDGRWGGHAPRGGGSHPPSRGRGGQPPRRRPRCHAGGQRAQELSHRASWKKIKKKPSSKTSIKKHKIKYRVKYSIHFFSKFIHTNKINRII